MPVGRLRWLCRRGNQELDLLLSAYLERRYVTAPGTQQAAFRRLLEASDACLQAWLLGQGAPDDPQVAELVRQIRCAFHSDA